MPCLPDVMHAFIAFRKSTKSFMLTERIKLARASCENLVHVGLVSDVPDELVIWTVEFTMQCKR